MTSKTRRMLLIVDPQIDFITGSLPVPGAETAMDLLAEYVESHGLEYDLVVVTCDRHPIGHRSFSAFGGEWPSHCVESSVGASVWPPLMKSLEKYPDHVYFLYKGEKRDEEEYSIFRSSKGSFAIDTLIKHLGICDIDICGLAGDVCVANTIKDAIHLYPSIRFSILRDFTASLDGGELISSIASSL